MRMQPLHAVAGKPPQPKTVAIVGAGPAGLVAAKEMLAAGLTPCVFDKAAAVGGMWASQGGSRLWPSMRTNLSHLTCRFSDAPWEAGTPLFPSQQQVGSYLAQYAAAFIPSECLRLGCEVTHVGFAEPWSGHGPSASPSGAFQQQGHEAQGDQQELQQQAQQPAREAGAVGHQQAAGPKPLQRWEVRWRQPATTPPTADAADALHLLRSPSSPSPHAADQGLTPYPTPIDNSARFDHVVIASGFYSLPHLGTLQDISLLPGLALHSSRYPGAAAMAAQLRGSCRPGVAAAAAAAGAGGEAAASASYAAAASSATKAGGDNNTPPRYAAGAQPPKGSDGQATGAGAAGDALLCVLKGRHVAVVGGGHSGAEVAADLAAHGAQVTHVMPRPQWTSPRLLPLDPASPSPAFVPLDLAFYRLTSRPEGHRDDEQLLPSPAELQARHACLRSLLGDDALVPQSLSWDPQSVDEAPLHLSISDSYLGLYRLGKIQVLLGRVEGVRESGLVVAPASAPQRHSAASADPAGSNGMSGAAANPACPGVSLSHADAAAEGMLSQGSRAMPAHAAEGSTSAAANPPSPVPSSSRPSPNPPVPSSGGGTASVTVNGLDAIILCTGFHPHLAFLPSELLDKMGYNPLDPFSPLLLHRSVLHPAAPGLAMVGMYRAPYFGIMELQARWAAAIFSGALPAPSLEEQQRGIQREAAIRSHQPRAQFPHPDYVGMALEYAALLAPLTPAAEAQRSAQGGAAAEGGGDGAAVAGAGVTGMDDSIAAPGAASAVFEALAAADEAANTAAFMASNVTGPTSALGFPVTDGEGTAISAGHAPTPERMRGVSAAATTGMASHANRRWRRQQHGLTPAVGSIRASVRDVVVPGMFRSHLIAAEAAAEVQTVLQAAMQGRGAAAAIFRSLPGTWTLDRRIDSRLDSSPSGRVVGEVTFSPTDRPLEWLYSERGSFILSTGKEFPVWRKYVYAYDEATDMLCVYFADGDRRGGPYLKLLLQPSAEQAPGESTSGQPPTPACGATTGPAHGAVDSNALAAASPSHALDQEGGHGAQGAGAGAGAGTGRQKPTGLAPGTGPGWWVATDLHPCVKDMYSVAHHFRFQGAELAEIQIHISVSGPQKDYTANAVLKRPSPAVC